MNSDFDKWFEKQIQENKELTKNKKPSQDRLERRLDKAVMFNKSIEAEKKSRNFLFNIVAAVRNIDFSFNSGAAKFGYALAGLVIIFSVIYFSVFRTEQSKSPVIITEDTITTEQRENLSERTTPPVPSKDDITKSETKIEVKSESISKIELTEGFGFTPAETIENNRFIDLINAQISSEIKFKLVSADSLISDYFNLRYDKGDASESRFIITQSNDTLELILHIRNTRGKENLPEIEKDSIDFYFNTNMF